MAESAVRVRSYPKKKSSAGRRARGVEDVDGVAGVAAGRRGPGDGADERERVRDGLRIATPFSAAESDGKWRGGRGTCWSVVEAASERARKAGLRRERERERTNEERRVGEGERASERARGRA